MKKLLSFFLFIPIFTSAQAQSSTLVNRGVDERVELLGIVFRLADHPGYIRKDFKSYTDDIYRHFEPHKNHPAVKFAIKMHKEDGIGYDDVAWMATHLSPPPQLSPLVPFTDDIPSDSYGRKNALKFAKLLRRFYTDADCKTFFENHRSFYKDCERLGEKLCENFEIEWYDRFFGEKKNDRFIIAIDPGNGWNSYGPSVEFPDGKRDIYSILAVLTLDSTATKHSALINTLIHEFNHSYINPLVNKYWANLSTPAEKILSLVEEEQIRHQYGDAKSMICEALVRANAIKYMADHGMDGPSVRRAAVMESAKGFLQSTKLVEKLQAYDNDRDTYPTFESYMPEIIRFYEEMADNLESKLPRIKAVEPFENGAADVDPDISYIKIIFDRPMLGMNIFRSTCDGVNLEFNMADFTGGDNTVFIIQPKDLKPSTKYRLLLANTGFLSKEEYPMEKNYLLEFTTASAISSAE